MKKIIIIFVLISGYLFAQSWNNIVITTINEPNLVQLENFTNRDGIHIVVQNSNATNSIKYYRLNSLGSVQTTTTIESQGGAEFPSIAGDNDHLYISYRLGNNIITKKYIYANSSWESQTPISLNNHDCDRVDNAYDWRGLHIVYSQFDGSCCYETHYWLYASSSPTKHKIVSDQSDYYGSYPTISLSSNKAHVGFNSLGDAKTRDKNLTTDAWENTQSVASGSGFEKLHSGCDKLFDFYHVAIPGIIINLYVKERNVYSTSWSSPQLLEYSVNPYIESLISVTRTNDGKTHILYDAEQLIHRSYNCPTSSWSGEYEVTSYGSLTQSSSLSSASNDLYVVYREHPGGSTYIKYRQYDTAPLAPQGLAVQPYQQGNNRYARLTWQLNNEPDVFIKQNNAYEIERRINFLGNWGTWQVIATRSGNVSEFIDYETVGVGDAEVYIAEYRMRARDYNNNISGYSSSVSIEFQRFVPTAPGGSGGWANKSTESSGNNISYDYNLAQNYPNPFNPTTTINYSIKSAGEVTLKIYDMLGTELASLVNESQEAGSYSVEFNAANLPSGMYVYRLSTNNFVDTKKLILLK